MASINHGESPDLLSTSVRAHWRLYLIEGVVLIVLGIGAVLIPVVASLAAAIALGFMFLIGGIVGFVATVMGRHAPGFWWSLLSATVTIIAGVLMIGWPFGGALSITLVLAAYLVVDGIVSMLFAVEHRRQLSRRWGWLLVNGVLDLLLAAVLVWFLPFAALWGLGLIIGIDFIFGGSSLIAMALAAHNAERA
ncbi:MAG TPA: DUF308 domain-containing protein [Micropepsaceae bacterium]|nr:DUF308 domain-containing protein [Micropepsaceae bacterium]